MAWLDTIFKFIGYARYNAITPNAANGEAVELQCGPDGRLLVSTEPINTTWADGGAAAATKTVKAAAGKLHQVFGRNTGGSDRFIFFYNATAKPSDGSTAHIFVPVKVKAGEAFSIELPRPRAFSVGLCWAASSTDNSLTYDAAGSFQVSAEYE